MHESEISVIALPEPYAHRRGALQWRIQSKEDKTAHKNQSPCNFRLLQQYRPKATKCAAAIAP